VSQVEKSQLKKIYHVHGRSTRMGAETKLEIAVVLKGKMQVMAYNHSKSHRHWEEVLLASPDAEGIVYHVNISNSGKHYCKILKVENGEVKVVDEAKGGWCPIHHY